MKKTFKTMLNSLPKLLLPSVLLLAGTSLQADIRLNLIGQYHTGLFDQSAAEISAFDPGTDLLFVVNANSGLIDVLDLSDPTNPVPHATTPVLNPGIANTGAINSVAVHNGIIAIALEADPKTDNGFAVFYDAADLSAPAASVPVGALPDMITFNRDGTLVLTANEGEPNADYSVDPEGSVSIIKMGPGLADLLGLSSEDVTTVSFSSFNESAEALRSQGVRIFGPGASVAQDLEPEYITVSPDNSTAFVALQENNALAVIDLSDETYPVQIVPLGFKDHNLPGNGLDASDRDDVINIRPWPIFGMYQPDAIASYEVDGATYIISANEGDARDYDTFGEEDRIKDLTLNATAFPNAAMLQEDAQLGRLTVTTTLGMNEADEYEALYAFGARSFSIWNSEGLLIWDSGDAIEQIVADRNPLFFNVDNDENDSLESRSDAKGPEPEGVTIGQVGDRIYAFIGLERVGGVLVYDVTVPSAPEFISWANSRDYEADDAAVEADPSLAVELGPEGLTFISADNSPNGSPLLVVTNEVSGSTSIYEIEERENYTLTILHFNDTESQLVHAGSLQDAPEEAPTDGFGGPDAQFVNFGGAARFISKLQALRSNAGTDGLLTISAGDNFLPGIETDASSSERNVNNPDGIQYEALAFAAANIDVTTLGNHDFDLGPDYLVNFLTQLKTGATANGGTVYPTSPRTQVVTSNVDASAVPALADFIVPSTVLNKGGERIGIIGGTVWWLGDISSPDPAFIVDADENTLLTVDDLASLVQDQVNLLEADGVNKIILVTHLQGVRNDQALIERIRGVDLIIAGGGNDLLGNDGDPVINGRPFVGPYPLTTDASNQPVLDLDGVAVPIVTTDGDMRYIGEIVIEFNADGEIVSANGMPHRISAYTEGVTFESASIINDGVEPNQFIFDNVVAPVFDYAGVLFGTFLADNQVSLMSERGITDPVTGLPVGKRVSETNAGNLTADAVLYEGRIQADYLFTSQPVIGFQNGGGIRNDGIIAPGELTLGDIFNFLPFTNFNTIIEGITPAMFKEFMEYSVSRYPSPTGSFLQIAGFSVLFDPTLPAAVVEGGQTVTPGQRIISITLDDGTKIVENGEISDEAPETITAATNSFVANGGDGYFWFNDASLTKTDAPTLYGDAVVNFVNEVLLNVIGPDRYGPDATGSRIQLPYLNGVFNLLTAADAIGWQDSGWMGTIWTGAQEDGWFYHPALGWFWLWDGVEDGGSVWIWTYGQGYLWTQGGLWGTYGGESEEDPSGRYGYLWNAAESTWYVIVIEDSGDVLLQPITGA